MIEVSALSKRYGDLMAIQNVSFEVKPGECFALLGPNGSGKTTTLKCLAGLAVVTSGTIHIGGIDVLKDGRLARARLSYLPQRVAFHESLTAGEVLTFFCQLRGLSAVRAATVLDELGFDGRFRNKTIGEFSGGMVQRLGIGVALLPDAPVLLLDEPASGLDPQGAIRFRELMRSLTRTGKTIVFSSHVLSDVALMADRVAVLVSGKLVVVQSAEGVEDGFGAGARLRVCLRNPESRFARVALQAGAADARLTHNTLTISSAPIARLPILQALERAGADVERFFTEEPNLEDFYLRFANAKSCNSVGNIAGGLYDPSTPTG